MKWWIFAAYLLTTSAMGVTDPRLLPAFFVDNFNGVKAFDCARLVQVGATRIPENPGPLYNGIVWRNLKEADEHLADPFIRYRKSLPVPSRILISAGGYGVDGLELAQMGHEVIVTNLDRLYDDRFSRLKDRATVAKIYALVVRKEARSFDQVGYDAVDLLNRLGLLFDLHVEGIDPPVIFQSYPNTGEVWRISSGVDENVFFDSVVRFAREAEERVRNLNRRRQFFYVPRPTLDAIANFPDGHFAMVVDLLGAFPNSLPRPALLKELQRVLAPGAKGFVVDRGTDLVQLTRPSSLVRFRDIIESHGGETRIYLRDYLKRLSQGRFDYYTHTIVADRVVINADKWLMPGTEVPVDVMVVTGDGTHDSPTPLDDLEIIPDAMTVHVGNGLHYPIAQYVEKSE